MLLEPFQARFLAAATAPGCHLAALSMPRGNGKSRLAAYLVERILNPADPLFRPGTESVLCAAFDRTSTNCLQNLLVPR